MTLPAARELASHGIRVMSIAPGIVHTPMIANLPDKIQEALRAMIPFPRRLTQPQEFAALCQHIIENPMLNGSTIRLDGAVRLAAK
jgi:NAD(P)-dependent dehydrogenase (short-subunit alcohol dehydrogenase family)